MARAYETANAQWLLCFAPASGLQTDTDPPGACFVVTKRTFSGCDSHGLLPRAALPLPLQQPRSDFVQIVGEYPEANVTFKTVKPFIQTPVESVMLQTVNVRFNSLVLIAQRPK